jgi:DNA-directed RNA polymerase subunit RPC12/RpoP
MWVIWAYCDHCGSEYLGPMLLAFVATYANGDRLRCKDCNHEIGHFEEWSGD